MQKRKEIMNWETYRVNFTLRAKEFEYDEEYINKCLQYSKNLFDRSLPVIYDQQHLSALLGYKYSFLLKVSNSAKNFYRNFAISKKNGGFRKISEPLPNLKEIQRWILEEILYKNNVSEFAKAYLKGKSIRDNVRFHRGQKYVITIDIKNFFPSISEEKVFVLFIEMGYSKPVSVMLAKLCCLNGKLPQGAVTSPMLSNIIMKRLDKRIAAFAVKNRVRYTRYADDLTFSGDIEPGKVINFVKKVLDADNFKINDSKTRVMTKNQRQLVTGSVVNEKLQAPREVRRKIRQELYYIKKFGLASHLEKLNSYKANYLKRLLGLINYCLLLNPKDAELIKGKNYLKELL